MVLVVPDSDESEEISEGEVSLEVIRTKRIKVGDSAATVSTNRRGGKAKDVEQQWVDKYAPLKSNDVCINPRKLMEVKQVLSNMILGSEAAKILVLCGPAGSSKSTLVKVLAKEMIGEAGCCQENENWTKKAEKGQKLSYIEYLDSWVSTVSYPDLFGEFLNDSRYRVGLSLAVILVEELPNIFHPETLLRFRLALKQWIHTPGKLPPLVICVSEVELSHEEGNREYFSLENSVTIDTLLGKELLDRSDKLKVIRFNPIAATYMRKSLKNIIAKERHIFSRIPQKKLMEVLEGFIDGGDIRSAISNLQFWSSMFNLGGALLSARRESQINLFHAIGKIIYSSSKFLTLSDEERDYLSVKDVQENYGNTSLLALSLLENYHIYNNLCYGLDVAGAITNGLSECDLMSAVEEGKDLGIRGTRLHLRSVEVNQNQKTQIKFPRHFKMLREFRRVSRDINLYRKVVGHLGTSFNNLNLIDGCLLPVIYNRRKQNRYRYDRLGGRFKQILSDHNLPVYEEEFDNWNRDGFRIQIEKQLTHELEHEEDLSDPIESDITSDEDIFNDSFDYQEIEKLVSQSKSQSKEKSTISD